MKAAPLEHRPEFSLMKLNDVKHYYHLQMPRWLFGEKKYADSLSLEAKVVYTFLLNRFQLSRLNGWVNDTGEVFIIYTRESLASEIQISYRKALECMKQLAAVELIWERRCGRGDANQIYLMTNVQEYLLSVLEQTICMKTNQAGRLINIAGLQKSGPHINSILRQLRYLGKIIFFGNDIISLPYHGYYDSEMLAAIDIMLDMTEKNILAVNTNQPFKLCFLTELENGIGNFAILPVPAGMEKGLAALVAETNAEKKTVIFLLADIRQKALLNLKTPHYFAIRDEAGEFRYFKGDV